MNRYAIVCAALLLASGCATVFKGSHQTLTFNSDPSGAEVQVDGIPMGQTPVALSLKKNKYKSVIIKKAGYQPFMQYLHTSYDAITLLNIFWDLSTTDLITGNAYEYEPGQYFVKLNPDASASNDSDAEDRPAPRAKSKAKAK